MCVFLTVHAQNQSLPTITLHPTGGIYMLGSRVTLECEAENADSIDWVHNGNTMVEDGTSLAISSLNDDLTGSYACVATNQLGV